MILKVRKDFIVFKWRDFIVKWFTVVDFHTLKAMFLLTTTEGMEDTSLSHCFVNSEFPCKTNFAWKLKLIYGGKKESKYFRKLYMPAS